ncbi:MAG: hypothetical protein R3C56_16005 [Pirellulaceae bacterium]
MSLTELVRLDSKRALVTGAAQGSVVVALWNSRAGADLILNDRPGNPDLAQTADDVRALGRRAGR